jgi:hypothetical protein
MSGSALGDSARWIALALELEHCTSKLVTHAVDAFMVGVD